MAKKTTPGAKPRTAPPADPTPELQPPTAPVEAKPAARRRTAQPGTTRAPRAAKAAADAVSAIEGVVPPRRTRKQKLPTQAAEQSLTPAPVLPPDTVTDEEIRMRAYFLSLERGPHGGTEMDYWLEAERELRSKPRKK